MVEKGYAKPEQMAQNQAKYIETMGSSPNVKYEDGIIVQYGGGSMYKPGSYDRYTPFVLHPEANFLVIAWPMGLVQASCNPFKEDRALSGINLGEMATELLDSAKSWFESKIIPLTTLKWVSETSATESSVGFTSKDLEAFYPQVVQKLKNIEGAWAKVKKVMDKPYPLLTEEELAFLDKFGLPLWDIIKSNSGGHKCITNISGLNYLGRSKRPPQGKYKPKGDPADDTPYIKFLKMLQRDFVAALQKKIQESKMNED